jgi:hypothetical protein
MQGDIQGVPTVMKLCSQKILSPSPMSQSTCRICSFEYFSRQQTAATHKLTVVRPETTKNTSLPAIPRTQTKTCPLPLFLHQLPNSLPIVYQSQLSSLCIPHHIFYSISQSEPDHLVKPPTDYVLEPLPRFRSHRKY